MHALPDPAPSLPALLAQRLATAPDSTVVIDGQGRTSVAQFDALVARAAADLQRRGVVRGDRVALWLVNGLEWLVLYFALARLGAALMTVNSRYRGAEVAYLLARSTPRLLFMHARFRKLNFMELLAEVDLASAASLQQVLLVDEPPAHALPTVAAMAEHGAPPPPGALPDRLLDRPAARWSLLALGVDAGAAAGALSGDQATATAPPALDAPDLPAILFTTSGTTSGPKLVVHTQRTVAAHVQPVARAMGMHASDACLLAALPFAGVFGFVSSMAMFAAGRPLVLTPTFDAAECAALLPRHAITHFFGSDEMFEALLQQVPEHRADGGPGAAPSRPFPTLRLCGFAAFRAGAVGVAQAAVARGLPMAGLYGSSEVHALFSLQDLQRPLAERLEGGGTLVNPAAQLRVRDADSGGLLAPGQVGLLEIRSPSNFIGYLNNAEATAQAIDVEGWFRTGDIGYLRDDGSFVYLTRAGDAIRLGGYLVSPVEIEEVIKTVPGIAAAQVVAVDLQGKTRAVACVVPSPGAPLAAQALAPTVIARVAAQLAAFKVPARVWAVDAFPVVNSANGTKIQRNKLRDMAQRRLADEAAA